MRLYGAVRRAARDVAGDAEAAVRAAHDSARIAAETHDRWFQSTAGWTSLTRFCSAARDPSDRGGRGDRPGAAPPDPEWVIKRHTARALLAASERRLAAAIAEADAATAAADATSMFVYRADAHSVRAHVLRLAGEPEPAASAAAETLRLYEAKQNLARARVMTRLPGRRTGMTSGRPISIGLKVSGGSGRHRQRFPPYDPPRTLPTPPAASAARRCR